MIQNGTLCSVLDCLDKKIKYMEIKAADVAKLRKMTGAGMMDCKKALQEADCDFEKAKDIIREKGKLIANKRADRDATEGYMACQINDHKVGYMLCLACETDFVSKNASFVASANEILAIAVKNNCADLNALMATSVNGQTVAEIVTEKSGQTGEKVEVAFYARVEAPYVVSYIHSNNKLGTLLGYNMVISEEIARDIAMQATAMAPIAIDEADCSPAILAKELEIGMEQARQEGKPENMLEKIAQGKVTKYIKENTILNQALVKNNKMTCRELIQSADPKATVVAYQRFSLND